MAEEKKCGKSPAVLLYTADFLIGTASMSNTQVGKYIRLLCMQHQRGHIPYADMMAICGRYDADIFSKFCMDNVGHFYNPRMEEEIKRRSIYVETRMKNLSLSAPTAPPYGAPIWDAHMENENGINKGERERGNNFLLSKKRKEKEKKKREVTFDAEDFFAAALAVTYEEGAALRQSAEHATGVHGAVVNGKGEGNEQ